MFWKIYLNLDKGSILCVIELHIPPETCSILTL